MIRVEKSFCWTAPQSFLEVNIVSRMLRQPFSAESKFIDSKSGDYFIAANLLFTNMLLVEFAVEKDSRSSS